MNKDIRPDVAPSSGLILIGADGSLGSAALSGLKNAGWNVVPTVFVRPPGPNELFLDVTRPETFEALPAGLPVVNCAGLPDQKAPAKLMRAVHVDGMRNLLRWAESSFCPHLIQISSVAVYGNATVGTGRREDTRCPRWNPLLSPLVYGRTKARAEVLLKRSRVPWSALRLPAVFGPGDVFFSREIFRLLSRTDRFLPSGGSRPVSLFPLDIIGDLLNSLLLHGALFDSRNAAGAHVPWNEILSVYAEAMGTEPRFSGPAGLRHYMNFADPGMQMAAWYGGFGAEFPDDRLREDLGWEPDTDWRKTARQAAEYLMASEKPGEKTP